MNERLNCVLCEGEANRSDILEQNSSLVNCDVCGNYVIDRFFEKFYEAIDREERAMLSAYTRMWFELRDTSLKLEDPADLWEEIEINQDKNLDEKVKNLILYIRKKSNELGDCIKCNAEKDYPVTYSLNPQEFEEILKLSIAKGLIIENLKEESLKLTIKGWKIGTEVLSASPVFLAKK